MTCDGDVRDARITTPLDDPMTCLDDPFDVSMNRSSAIESMVNSSVIR